MCVRGSFLNKSDYQNLSIQAIDRFMNGRRIKFVPPAIFKPEALWTGKQVLSTIILNLCGEQGLNYAGFCKMKDTEFKHGKGRKIPGKPYGNKPEEQMNETLLVCRKGNILSGYLDKAQISATKYSIIAAIEELFGGPTAANFITALTYCLSHYLKCYRGFTLSIRDVITSPDILAERNAIAKTAKLQGLRDLAIHFGLCTEADFPDVHQKEFSKSEKKLMNKLDVAIRSKIREAHLIGKHIEMKEIDAVAKKSSNIVTEKIHRLCEKNLECFFPENNLEMLIATGAKGSKANLLNMCSNLGQVEFDGKRAKMMISGRTFPCFKPYEHMIRAGAFISNRYASGGLRPQEMFFHTMAGRDGLIDTSCKTASSGKDTNIISFDKFDFHLQGVVTIRSH